MEQVDERVSIRVERDEMEDIDSFISKLGYPSRSEFFRTAARARIQEHKQRNAVSVEVASLLLEYIEGLVDRGYFRSREHAIQAAIDSFFTEDRINQSLRAADGMEVAAGKKVKVDIDDRPQKIVSR